MERESLPRPVSYLRQWAIKDNSRFRYMVIKISTFPTMHEFHKLALSGIYAIGYRLNELPCSMLQGIKNSEYRIQESE